jgi:hypothetical protein
MPRGHASRALTIHSLHVHLVRNHERHADVDTAQTGGRSMRSLIFTGVALLAMGSAATAFPQKPSRCADIADPTARLVCYDRGASPPQAAAPSRSAAPAVTRAPVYTPATVSKDGVPVPPEDRAFDPSAQNAPPQRLAPVQPTLRRTGSVPILSAPGTGVPEVSVELPSLRPVPGDRWVMGLLLANNSAHDLDVRLTCLYRNGGRPVADIDVMVRDVRAGERVAADIPGPRVTTFVDSAHCDVR